MVFSSLVFIFRFIPIFFLIYFCIPNRFKNIFLVVGSLFFYAYGENKYFILIIFSIFIDFFISKFIWIYKDNRKAKISLLLFSIFFNLGVLFIFKYFNFFLQGINEFFNVSLHTVTLSLPLGISFYTFQTLSYTIDVFNEKIIPETNIIDFAAFVSLFPQLIAGPIVKYTDIKLELKNRSFSKQAIEKGIELFILGLGQKVILANNLGMLWDEIGKMNLETLPTALAWLGLISYSLQIYFDFSGYSLMAIGLGKILGFNFPINFNYPYISRSISEFWRRWHITLGNWFKEYLYIPLGGNKVGTIKLFRNLLIIWIFTGMWHGAEVNFLIWGLYFFIVITLEKYYLKTFLKENIFFSHIYTVFLLLIGWVIFSMSNLTDILNYFQSLFSFRNGEFSYYFRNYFIIIAIGIFFSTPIIKNIYYKIIKKEIIHTVILIAIFIISISYLIDSTYNPFLYFRF